MKAREAVKHFRGAERLNCAQAVLKAFEREHGVSQDQILTAARTGGGRADGGLCGALYAARSLVGDAEVLTVVERRFEELAGARRCREIRKLGRLSCKECVALSAELVQRHTL